MSRKRYQAKYFQENKDKILAKRRDKRLKDQTAGQKELFLESAAPPPKVEQQTVDNLDEVNELSISNVEELFPVKTELTNEYAMAGGMEGGEFGPSSIPSGTGKIISGSRQNSRSFSAVDRGSVDLRNVDSKSQSVDQAIVDRSVDQHSEVNTVVDPSDVDRENNTVRFAEEDGRKPLSYFFVSAGILVLLGMNTFFLIGVETANITPAAKNRLKILNS